MRVFSREKAGLRTGRSQVIDALEAQEIEETGMKKVSTVAVVPPAFSARAFSQFGLIWPVGSSSTVPQL